MPERGRVLQLLGPSTGGIRAHVAALTTELERRGWEVWVAGPAGVMTGVGRQDHTVPVPWGLRPDRLLAARVALARLARDVDLVHAHALTPGWLAASLRRPPAVVVTVHNLVLGENVGRVAPLLRALEGRLPARADRTIVVSSALASRFAGRRGADRVHVIQPVAPAPAPRRRTEEVRAALGVPAGAPLVVTVARLAPQKDLPTLLQAAALLRRRRDDVRVVVIGQGRLEAELRAFAARLGLDGTVSFAGPSPYAVDELAAADVVVLSSRWEGTPVMVAEAMQLGRPVVATAVGGVPDLVDDGVTGRLVPAADPQALADALADVLSDPARARSMGDEARRRAGQRLDPARLVSLVEDVYRATLGAP